MTKDEAILILKKEQENTRRLAIDSDIRRLRPYLDALDIALKSMQRKCENCGKYRTIDCVMDIWTDEAKIYRAKPDDYCNRWEKAE